MFEGVLADLGITFSVAVRETRLADLGDTDVGGISLVMQVG